MLSVDIDISHRMASLRKLYSLTSTNFLKVKDSNRDLPTVANAHTSVTSASTAVLPTVANAHTSVTSASTAILGVLPSQIQPIQAYPQQQHSFKCDECESKCDEGDICSNTNCQLTCHKHGRHLKIGLPDSFSFV